MSDIIKLVTTPRPFLTDGGFETSLFFQKGFEAPEFAAIVLLDDSAARQAMIAYFDEYLGLAAKAGTGFVLDTATWRGCTRWAPDLGRDEADLLRLNRDAVTLAHDIRGRWRAHVAPILVNGVVGPAGDGYRPHEIPTAAEARNLHRPQIETFAQTGVDMISAITMTNTGEAIGISQAAADVGLPVVISFTVETDGHLPTGDALGKAIEAVDAATDGAPIYYMVNCAHPEHFAHALASGETWVRRVGGIRANASRLSHAELDEAEALDEGNPQEFGALHLDLARDLPNLRVVGGCCGTDHRHVGHVSDHLHLKSAA